MTATPDALLGALAADALAMPVHWYYDRTALARDYGEVASYLAPRNPHPDSILWRSSYRALNEQGDILHDQARYWGQRGVHYHQFLAAGENTLNFQLATRLFRRTMHRERYEADDWLEFYVHFMLMPGQHRDTYLEEYHRDFFTNYARGRQPRACGVADGHIGGLVPVPALFAALAGTSTPLAAVVQEHVGLTHRDPAVLRAADCLLRILEAVRAGQALRAAILTHGTDWISAAKVAAWNKEADATVIGRRLSPACYIADAFPAALYLAWKYAADFSAGIVANARVGGDNCHRGAVVGALLGEANGVPPAWHEGLLAEPELAADVGGRHAL